MTVVERLSDIALDMGPLTRGLLLNRMAEKKIRVITNRKVSAILANQVRMDTEDGPEVLTAVDTMVIAMGSRPINDLANGIKKEGFTVNVVGDAAEPRRIYEAIHEGFKAAFNIGIIPVEHGQYVLN